MRARGAVNRNRDGTIVQKRQGDKGGLCKESTEIPCDQIFLIYISHTCIQTQSTFPRSPIRFKQTKLYKCNRLFEGWALPKALSTPFGVYVHLCTPVLHEGTQSQPLERRGFLSTVHCPFCTVAKQMLMTTIGIVLPKQRNCLICKFTFINTCFSVCKFFSAR